LVFDISALSGSEEQVSLRQRLFRGKPEMSIRVQLQRMYAKYLREVVKYPKIYKPTLGQDLRECFMFLRTKVNHALHIYRKQTALREADTALDNLRDVIWATYEVGCISEGQYGLWIEEISLFGMMLGGWIKETRAAEGGRHES